MSRIRSLKPEFFVSEQVVECSTNARLLFIGLWCFCDDAGIHPASTKRLKMEVFPADAFTDDDVQQWMDELNRAGLVSTYRAENTDYWRVTGWSRHQKIDRPTYRYPQPEPSKIADASPNNRRGLAEHSPSPRDGVESNGVESNGSRPVPDGTGCRQPAADNANADIQKREFCPYQQIINAYHVHFPSGPPRYRSSPTSASGPSRHAGMKSGRASIDPQANLQRPATPRKRCSSSNDISPTASRNPGAPGGSQ
jgi:hypothetical protein